MNAIDKMISYISPKTAFVRMGWRAELERNFNSGKSSRLPQNFRPANGTAEQVNKTSRDKLRAVARSLENNSDIAESVIKAFERNVIGSGITLQIKTTDEEVNKTIEALFKEWGNPSNCDITGELSFLDIQKLVIRRMLYDGGILIKKVIVKDNKIPFMLQLLEVDGFDCSAMPKNTNNRCFDGVEVNLFNRPVKYHIKKYDKNGFSVSSEAIDAKDIIFLRRIKRPSQVRELSEIARAMDRISSTDEYLDAVSMKERIAACLAIFITKNNPGGGSGMGRGSANKTSDAGMPLKDITPGMIQHLNTGEDATIVNPNGQSSDTETFIRTEQRLLAAGMGLSYETVARDLSNVNYSSARQNLLDDRATFKDWQTFIIEHFCEAIFDEFIKALKLKGLVKISDDLIIHEWVGSGWSWIDPLKEAKADEVALVNNLSTLQRICAEKGLDWKEVLEQRQKEMQYMETLGLVLPAKEDILPSGDKIDEKTVATVDETISKISLNGA